MKELFGENPSEMLSLLVDGELSSAQESTLYSQLAINDELRNEFRELLTIRESVKLDIEAFSPPVNSLENILSGISINNPIPYNSNSLRKTTKTNNLFRKLLVPAIAVLITALITALLMINYYENNYSYSNTYFPIVSSLNANDDEIETQEALIKNKDNKNQNNFNFNSNNTNSKKIIKNKMILDDNNISEIQKNASTEQSKNEIISSSQNNNSPNQFTPSQLNFSNIITSNKSNLYIQDNKDIFNIISIRNTVNQKKQKNLGYSLHLRGLSSQSFPDVDMPSQSKPIINNIVFGAFLSADINNKLGFEIGKEPFGQRFVNVENNYPNEYEQNPILFWAGLSYRFELDKMSILGGFQPFAQFTIGSTELGPLGRTILGIQYFNESGIGFSLGLEGVLLLYENQKVLYTTKKLGLTYGMFINF